MADPLRQDVVDRLQGLAALLTDVSQPRWAHLTNYLAGQVGGATDEVELRAAVAEVMTLFGGMGSFNDLVLQDRSGVLPEQDELDLQRSELYDSVRRLVA